MARGPYYYDTVSAPVGFWTWRLFRTATGERVAHSMCDGSRATAQSEARRHKEFFIRADKRIGDRYCTACGGSGRGNGCAYDKWGDPYEPDCRECRGTGIACSPETSPPADAAPQARTETGAGQSPGRTQNPTNQGQDHER